jgi:single-strand DNA-binding protein
VVWSDQWKKRVRWLSAHRLRSRSIVLFCFYLMNSCVFIGRLGRDPEIKFFDTGKSVCSFSIAVDRGRDRDPLWLPCKAWGKTGELVNDYCKKGNQVAVQGALDEEVWTDRRDGTEKRRTVVTVLRVTFVGSKADRTPEPAAPAPAAVNRYDDEEVPF